MKFRSVLLLVAVAGLTHLAAAAELQFAGITLSLPNQLVGPLQTIPDANSQALTFYVPRAIGTPTTVLQLTRYDFGTPVPLLNEGDMVAAASVYLLQFLRAAERTRTSYSQTVPEKVLLGGHVGVRSHWVGTLHGARFNGVVYCVLVGSRALFFHASGPGETPDNELLLVIQAVENLSVDS